jgi:formyl-CoA transferase
VLAAWTARHERDGLVERLRRAGIPCSPVQSIDDLWTDAHYRERRMLQAVDLPALGPEDLFRAPWLLSDFTPEITGRGPLLGEHNEIVFKEMLGLSEGEFGRLQANGVMS